LDYQVQGVTDRAPFSQQTPFEKRTIDVNETVSTIVALVYLVVWLVGMIVVCAFCCRSRPRDRKLNLSLPWRRERGKGKQPEGSDMGLTVWSAFFVNIIRAPHLPQVVSRIGHMEPSDAVLQEEGLHKQYPFSYSWTAKNAVELEGRDELGIDDRMSGAPGDPMLLCQDPTYPRGEAMRGDQEAVLGSNAGFSRVTAPAASSSKQYNALLSAPRVHFFRTQDSLQNV